jgi:Kef-type K+ transport system membrane component KefB
LIFDLVILFAVIFATAVIARSTDIPITALEIIAGIALAYFISFTTPSSVNAIVSLGSLLIVFLAGYETGLDFLKLHFSKALLTGLCAFLVPFIALLLVLTQIVHAPLIDSLIGSAALSDISISIVYTTLRQYDIVGLQLGRMILAITLMVNILEDSTVTMISLGNSTSILSTSLILGGMLGGALVLPSFLRKIEAHYSTTFSSIPTRFILFSLALMSALSSLAGVPGILFIFLLGLLYSRKLRNGTNNNDNHKKKCLLAPLFSSGESYSPVQKNDETNGNYKDSQNVVTSRGNSETEPFLDKVMNFAFAAFIPLYFVAVGLKVNLTFVLANLPVLLLIVGVATIARVFGAYAPTRRYFGSSEVKPLLALFNTRLTSATVILLLSLTLNVISDSWYSLFISAVVILAVLSSVVLRLFPQFMSSQSAKAAFSREVDEKGATKTAPIGLN